MLPFTLSNTVPTILVIEAMCQMSFDMHYKMDAVSFRYWDDCVDPEDLEAMWADPNVRAEWIGVGETKGSKVHLSRDPDGQPYLTQTEMRVSLSFTDSFTRFSSYVRPKIYIIIENSKY